MAVVEGKGRVKPTVVKITILPGERQELTELARHRDNFRRYRERRDEWGRGLVPDAVLLGIIGERAICRFYNHRLGLSLDVDTEDRDQRHPGSPERPRQVRLLVAQHDDAN